MKIHNFNPTVNENLYKMMKNGDFAVAFVPKNSILPDRPKDDETVMWVKAGDTLYHIGELTEEKLDF